MNGAVGFGLLAALVWGAGDFYGGLATRRAPPFSVVLVAEISGAVLLLLAALAWRQPLPNLPTLGWSAGAGLSGAIGLVALYTALARGQMGVVAPTSAVIAALVPIIASAYLEGAPDTMQILGFAVALVAVWLLSGTGTGAGRRAGSVHELRLALLAGLGFGFYFVLIDRADPLSGFWNLTFARSFAAVVLAALMLAIRHPLLPPRDVLPLNTLNGTLDAGGNLFFVLAAQSGRLDVASVLASLYPGTTVLLAWLVLGERLSRPQTVGVAAALLAIILIVL
jgi:drug/metabolite transporter (DMT)-like permease